MEKQIFRKGDRVFDIRHGWGKVTICRYDLSYPIGVQFDEDDSQEVILYLKDGKFLFGDKLPLLSFTEYGFDNRFSQKRIADYNEYLGKWGKFWDKNGKDYVISRLERVKSDGFKSNSSIAIYDNFEPLTDEQLEVLGLENR